MTAVLGWGPDLVGGSQPKDGVGTWRSLGSLPTQSFYGSVILHSVQEGQQIL